MPHRRYHPRTPPTAADHWLVALGPPSLTQGGHMPFRDVPPLRLALVEGASVDVILTAVSPGACTVTARTWNGCQAQMDVVVTT